MKEMEVKSLPRKIGKAQIQETHGIGPRSVAETASRKFISLNTLSCLSNRGMVETKAANIIKSNSKSTKIN